MVPNARFTEFLADVEPSPTTKSNAAAAHAAVRTHLREHRTYRYRMTRDFLAGSYARDTAIRPKIGEDGIERPDVDVVVVTNHTTSDTPDQVLQELAKALAEAFKVERINKRSVRILTANAEIDVVPVIPFGLHFKLPDRDSGTWKETNPPGHISWSSGQNLVFKGRFKPLVKLFKWWRRENKTGKRPKGFILEVLTARHAPSVETHYGEAFAQMLSSIYTAYGSDAAQNRKPFIEDPALPGNDILSKVSITDWKNFIERVRIHAGYARRAQDTDDMDEATRLWRILFGTRFPSTANAAKATSLATRAVAPASAGYDFPDTPVNPKKPRGFA